MRRHLTGILLLTLLASFALAAPASAKCCSCTSPSGECSASACCLGGCYAICLRNHCESGCLDNFADPAESRVGEPSRQATISFSHERATAEQVSTLLSRAMKAEVSFAPFESDEPFGVEIQNAPPARLLEVLAKFGLVTVGGERVSPRELVGRPEQLFSFDAKDLPIQRLAELLSRTLGREVAISSSEPDQRITLQIQDASAERVLRVLAKMADVRVDGEQILPH